MLLKSSLLVLLYHLFSCDTEMTWYKLWCFLFKILLRLMLFHCKSSIVCYQFTAYCTSFLKQVSNSKFPYPDVQDTPPPPIYRFLLSFRIVFKSPSSPTNDLRFSYKVLLGTFWQNMFTHFYLCWRFLNHSNDIEIGIYSIMICPTLALATKVSMALRIS